MSFWEGLDYHGNTLKLLCFVSRCVLMGIEVVPLGIHVAYLLFRGWFHIALPIRMVTLTKITLQHLSRWWVWKYTQLFLNHSVLNGKSLHLSKEGCGSINF